MSLTRRDRAQLLALRSVFLAVYGNKHSRRNYAETRQSAYKRQSDFDRKRIAADSCDKRDDRQQEVNYSERQQCAARYLSAVLKFQTPHPRDDRRNNGARARRNVYPITYIQAIRNERPAVTRQIEQNDAFAVIFGNYAVCGYARADKQRHQCGRSQEYMRQKLFCI